MEIYARSFSSELLVREGTLKGRDVVEFSPRLSDLDDDFLPAPPEGAGDEEEEEVRRLPPETVRRARERTGRAAAAADAAAAATESAAAKFSIGGSGCSN